MPFNFPQRKLGDDFVSAIGLGCMGMSIVRSTAPDDEESLQVLTAAADMGLNFWVTSDYYGPFTNEKLLGRWFKETGRRDEIFLVTKFGVKLVDGAHAMCSTPEHVKEACQASLERLNTDHIDLYMQHRVDTRTPIEKTIEAMVELKNEGKIRYLGLSECSASTLRRASKVHQMAAIEMEYSPFALDIESEEIGVLKAAREFGVSIIPYSPLGRGFMTGAIKSLGDLDAKDMRRHFPRFSEKNFADNLKVVDAISAIAKEKGCTPGQLTLAWILAQGEDFIPIPGTTHVKYLQENAESARVKLTKDEEQLIRNTIASVGGTKGTRYPVAYMATLFGNSPELDNN